MNRALFLLLGLAACDPSGPVDQTRPLFNASTTSVQATPASLSVSVGGTGNVHCDAYQNGNIQVGEGCFWKVIGRDTQYISQSAGNARTTDVVVTGKKVGAARLRASNNGFADTVIVTVTNTPPPPPGVTIAPGEDAQAKVNANPTNTVFRLLAGTHVRLSVIPKSGDQFICDPGAVLDGQNVAQFGIHAGTVAPYPNNVTIKKCEAKNYATPAQLAVFMQARFSTTQGGTGWVIDSNNVHNNAACGIRGSTRGKIRGNNSHHNGTMGISGIGDSLEVSGNEIAFNNPSRANMDFEAGGTKFVLTTGFIFRGNYVHDNGGPGGWLDIDNDKFLIENNRIEDNVREGIAVEISYSGVVRNNTVRRNGLEDTRATNWPWGAGISIAASGGTGIDIYGNTLEGNAHQFAMIQQDRGCNGGGTCLLGPYIVQNINFHDNTEVMQNVAGHPIAGSLTVNSGVDDRGLGSTAGLYDKAARNIQSDHNTITQIPRDYTGMSVGGAYAWANAWRNLTQWRGFGFDVNSAVTP